MRENARLSAPTATIGGCNFAQLKRQIKLEAPTDIRRIAAGALEQRSAFTPAVFVLGLAGVAVPFVPFAENTTPWEAMRFWGMWRQVLPAFLPALVAWLSLRWMVTGRLSRAERILALGAGILATTIVLSAYAWVLMPERVSGSVDWASLRVSGWLLFLLPFLVLLGGGWLIGRSWRRTPPPLNAICAAELPFIVDVAAVVWYFEETNIGASVAALTSVAYVVHIAAVSLASSARSAASMPALAGSGERRHLISILQDVPRLTFERTADRCQRREADRLCLAVLQHGDVRHRDADSFGKLGDAHLPLRQHDVDVDDDCHGSIR